MDKYAPEDIPSINSTCFKLNSLQLQALLQNYHCAPDEPFIPMVRVHTAGMGFCRKLDGNLLSNDKAYFLSHLMRSVVLLARGLYSVQRKR